MHRYLDATLNFMERTTGSIHDHHTTFPCPGLPEFLAQAPNLLNLLTLAGLRKLFLALHPWSLENACDPQPLPACASGWRCCRVRCWKRLVRTAHPTAGPT